MVARLDTSGWRVPRRPGSVALARMGPAVGLSLSLVLALVASPGCLVDFGDGTSSVDAASRDSASETLDAADAGMDAAGSHCGDGVRDEGEECDGEDLAGQTCELLGYAGGTLACDDFCRLDTAGCVEGPLCGNGVLEAGERCDDGNTQSGDGCSADCATVEDYFSCSGSPSECTCRVLVSEASTGPADGKTWETALASVSEGIQLAWQLSADLGAVCEVWVGGGTYYVFGGDAWDTVGLAAGVDVYGGFCGTEESRSQRSPEPLRDCPSILDGGTSRGIGRVTTVVSAVGAGSAVMDGFVVRGGMGGERGGGLYVDGFELEVRNCSFSSNQAARGGAIYVDDGGEVRLLDTIVDSNDATEGAGIYVAAGGTVAATGLVVSHNAATVSGGGLYVERQAWVRLWETRLRNNQARRRGGGAFVLGAAEVHDATFLRNTASLRGGGLAVTGYDGHVLVEDSLFEDNDARDGGGLAVLGFTGDATAVVDRCVFERNSSQDDGGAVAVLDGGSLDLIRSSLFVNNWAGDFGGAIAVMDGSARVVNCTVTGNHGRSSLFDGGGGIAVGSWRDSGSAELVNSIVWANHPIDVGVGIGGDVRARNCDIGFTDGRVSRDGETISEDPLFSDPGSGDYRLRWGSPCIDTGVDGDVGDLDLDGRPRLVDFIGVGHEGTDVVDMGAYERQP